MNFELWEKVLNYTSTIKYKNSETIYIPDKILRKQVAENFIINKFLGNWIDRNQDDPIDILDDMLIIYYKWENDAMANNNKDLLIIYENYIRTLINVKNYIKKETM